MYQKFKKEEMMNNRKKNNVFWNKAALILGIFAFLSMANSVNAQVTVIDSGYCGASGNNLSWKLTSDSVLTISGSGAMENYNSSNNLAPWKSIYSTRIKTVIIGNSVTTIGDCAFYDCTSLASLTIGDSVITIGEAAFYGHSRLTSVTIPNSVITIKRVAFRYNYYLTSVIIGNSVTTIGSQAFLGCSYLTSLTIGNSVTMIDEAFVDCIRLTSIICEATTPPIIDEYAFYNVPTSISVYVPCSSISAYQNSPYWNNFTNFIFTGIASGYCGANGNNLIWRLCNDSVLTISGSGAMVDYIPNANDAPWYSYRSQIKTIIIDESVSTIGNAAFYECGNLTSVTIPNSVTSIGDSAFAGCIGLQSIICKAITPPTIDSNTFNLVPTNIPIYIPCPSIDAYQNTPYWSNFSNFIVTIIASGYCGANGNNLTWMFCDDILAISGTGAMYNDDYYGNYPWSGYRDKIKTIIIGDSVTTIGNYAFCFCKNLTSVTIPNSVTTIGNSAFENCVDLTSITIPNSVTTIGDYAFHASSLTSIMIPDCVINIGDGAFSGTFDKKGYPSLISINVDSNNIAYCSENDVLFNKAKTILVQYPIGKTDTNYIIPDSVAIIGDWAFAYCFYLTSVTIPNSVTTIGKAAFKICSSLTSVTIPNRVTTIGYEAFHLCRFSTITIPNSVTSIGKYAFWSCSFLTSITIGKNVDTIRDGAFGYCRNLKSVTTHAKTAPTLGTNVFRNVPDTIPIYIPCGSLSDYSLNWSYFSNFIDTIITDTTFYTAAICQGETYTDDNFTNLTQTETLYKTLPSTNGCDSIIKLALTVNPLPTKPVITQNGNILTSSVAHSYQWHSNNSPISGATNQTYSYTQNGVYFVEVSNKEGCTAKSDTITITNVGIKNYELRNTNYVIYPNPTTGKLTIRNEKSEVRNVEIYDIYGKKLSHFTFHNSHFTIDISHLANGMYFLKIGNFVQKIIKE